MRASVLAALFFVLTAPAYVQAEPMPDSFAPLVERLSPAVVNISTAQKVSTQQMVLPFGDLPQGQGPGMDEFRDFFERFGGGQEALPKEVFSLGSGFIISPEGYVVTNHHVVEKAEEIDVILSDDTKLKAKLVGSDPKTDIALLKVEAKHPLPYVSFGNSDQVKVGDWIVAIGNPFGLGGSVTSGIISARARNINAGPFDDFLQTDAAINRGNSGGPMFNLNGEVIGINTAIFSPTGGNVGIGFAVPSELAKPVIEQLKQFGRTHRGWLGVKIQHVTDEIADSVGLKETQGALVVEVTKDGPADKSGLQAGDVITRFNGVDIKEMRQLPRRVAETPIGKKVEVTVWRNGKRKDYTVTLGELKEEEESQDKQPAEDENTPNVATKQVMGVDVAELTPQLRDRYGLDDDVTGVMVVRVPPESEAAKQGVNRQDVIMQAGDDKVKNIAELEKAVSAARNSGRNFILLRVLRGGEILFLTLPAGSK